MHAFSPRVIEIDSPVATPGLRYLALDAELKATGPAVTAAAKAAGPKMRNPARKMQKMGTCYANPVHQRTLTDSLVIYSKSFVCRAGPPLAGSICHGVQRSYSDIRLLHWFIGLSYLIRI